MTDQVDPIRAGLYLYGVVPSVGTDGQPLTITVAGLDGAPVQVVAYGDVGVLTHSCSPRPYEGDVAQVHAWVLAQHEVISAAHANAGTILPIRFNSIVAPTADRSAAEVLVDWLSRCHDAVAARLEALRGRVELGVQLFAEPVPSEASPPTGAPVSRGRAYFQAQLAQRQERERIRATEALTAREVFDELAARADGLVVNPQRPVREGTTPLAELQGGGRLLLDVALLAQPQNVSAVGQYLAGVESTPGLSVRFTGPWAPYAFAGAFDMPLLVSATPNPTIDHGTSNDA